MRMVGTQLQEEVLLFGEGAWAEGLSVLNGQNARLLAPRCGAPFWTPLLGKKGKLSAELSTRAVCTSSPMELPATRLCPGTVHGWIPHSLHTANSSGLSGPPVALLNTIPSASLIRPVLALSLPRPALASPSCSSASFSSSSGPLVVGVAQGLALGPLLVSVFSR